MYLYECNEHFVLSTCGLSNTTGLDNKHFFFMKWHLRLKT